MQSLASFRNLSINEFMEKAMDLTDSTFPDFIYTRSYARDDSDPLTPGHLNWIGNTFWERYKAGRRAIDLERAISSHERSVRLTPDFDPEQGTRLSAFGVALSVRFEKTGDKSDIEAARFCLEGSLLSELRGAATFERTGNLSVTLLLLAERTGHEEDLARAVTVLQQLIELTPDGHPSKPASLNNLGRVLETRFNRLGDISDLEMAISVNRQAVKLTPDGHPDKPDRLNSVGIAFQRRFDRLGDISDLEMVISVMWQAVELTPDGHPDKARPFNNLGNAFQIRFDHLGDISDLEMAISVKRQAVELTPNGHPDRPVYFNNLGSAFQRRFDRLGDISDLEMAISVNRQAVELTPYGHPDKPHRFNNLGSAFQTRFNRLGDISDLEMAISVKRQAVELTPDGHPDKPACFTNLGNAFEARFNRLGDISDLERAISAQRQAVELTPDGHPLKPTYLNNLGSTSKTRFDRLGDISDLDMAISVERQGVELTPDGHPEKSGLFKNLGNAFEARFNRLGDISDLERAISVQRQAVELTPDGHPDKPGRLSNLGVTFQTRFDRLGDISDLQSAVTSLEQSVNSTSDRHMEKPTYLWNLTRALVQRYQHHRNVSDLEAAIDGISAASQSTTGFPSKQFRAARWWSELSEMVNDEQQTLRAYDCALGLIPRVAWMGMSMEGRHRELEHIGEVVRSAAAAAVRSGDPDRALQWLEQGRSVVWGQSLQQRSPLDMLRERDSIRADRLTEISRDLESNAKETESSAEGRGDQHRALILEWDALVLEVRKLDGFDDFLGPKKVSQLLTAASSCPIVVLNAQKAGCDALILMAEADTVIHIPLNLSSERAQELVNTLETIKSRHSRGRSAEPADRGFKIVGNENYDPETMIKGVLAELWTSVVKPVLDALAFSPPEDDSDDLPRICWCPTGPVAFLPIHAAGLYDTDERGTKVFDLVVSSYTPTVSALLQSPSPNPTLPKIFAVAQAQQTICGFSALPSTRKEIRLIAKTAEANSIDLVVAEDGAGTVKRVLNGMMRCSWVHLACHGTQDLDDPTKSAFILADGDLELSEIIKHPLPHAEFAFLSACQTATGDAKLVEEAVHLAAGMMLAGYQSVIATMWSILDKDGPNVADDVYAEMLKDGKADYTRAAYALHHAVRKLRLSGAPFMAWMPFIHMGR